MMQGELNEPPNIPFMYEEVVVSFFDGANNRIKLNDIEMKLRLGSALSDRMEISGYVVDARV